MLRRWNILADIKSPKERSKNMAAIHSKNTKPEVFVRKLLYSKGYRYRCNYTKIEGHPDIYFGKYRVAIFVNGCFWHRHQGCKYAYTPKSKIDFWDAKFRKNIERDKYVHEQLTEKKIRYIVIWECTIKGVMKNPDKQEEFIDTIKAFVKGNEESLEL